MFVDSNGNIMPGLEPSRFKTLALAETVQNLLCLGFA